MKRLILFIFLIMMTSCGAKKSAVIPQSFITFTPKLNHINNAEVGITLVSQEKGPNYDVIKITKEFKTKAGYVSKTIKVGKVFINDNHTEKYHLYSNSDDVTFGIAIPKNGDSPMIYNTSQSGKGLRFKPLKEKIEYTRTTFPIKEKVEFIQEFIYNGQVGDAIKFTYREFVGDYARPAFTQDLQYDLSESKTIGFRGLRIEIINATNTKIEYKVKSYFDN